MYIYLCVYIYVYICIYISIYIYVCIYIYTYYVYIYILCIYICIYYRYIIIHIHTHLIYIIHIISYIHIVALQRIAQPLNTYTQYHSSITYLFYLALQHLTWSSLSATGGVRPMPRPVVVRFPAVVLQKQWHDRPFQEDLVFLVLPNQCVYFIYI
jgi:hypothetical protein